MNFVFPSNGGGYVSPTVPLVMFAWIPIVLYLFSKFPAKKAVVISFITAWLFLPEAELILPGIPDYNKISATCYGILLATFLFDAGRFSTFKFRWLDVPMAIWCICPLFSSITNDLGIYDGVAGAVDQTMVWGIPYFLGRIYISSLDGIRLLAKGIFIGGLVYVPLCLLEVRLSPQLHRIVYGSAAFADFGQSIRYGGYRPSVFMRHGLAVGAFMMIATLIGFWLWRSGTVKRVWDIQMQWLVGALFVTFVLLRSSGALLLLVIGLGVIFLSKQLRSALPVFLLIGGIVLYLYISAGTENYFSDQIITYLSNIFPPDRIESLQFRFDNEELLVDKARERIWFGWGGYGRALVPINNYGRMTVQDSLWIIAFGHRGLVGLVSLFTAMLLPVVVLFWTRYPARLWFKPKVTPLAIVAIGIVLYMVDCVLNSMINPIYILACGGVAGLALKPREKLKRSPRQIPSVSYGLMHQR